VSIQPAQIRRQTNPCRTSESVAACGTSAMTRSRVAFVSLHSAQRGVSPVRTSAIRGHQPPREVCARDERRSGAETGTTTSLRRRNQGVHGGRIAPTVAARWPATLHSFSVAASVRPAARSQPNRQQPRSQLGGFGGRTSRLSLPPDSPSPWRPRTQVAPGGQFPPGVDNGGRIRAVRAGPGVSSFASAPQTTPLQA
jgi:hypothetical protein